MSKKLRKLAAVLLALMLPLSMASCKGVDRVGLPENGISSMEEESSSAEKASSDFVSSAAASSDLEEETSEPEDTSSVLSAPVSSGADSTPKDNNSASVEEYPSSSEPLPPLKSESVSSIEEKIIEANLEVKAAETQKPQSVKTENPQKPASDTNAPADSGKTDAKQETNSSNTIAQSGEKLNHAEMKAVWLSFLEFQAFSGSSEDAYTSKIQAILDNIAGKGLNTVIVQVRPYGDSFYESAYYPWSKCISGTMGVGVDYDPVEIVVRESHARGLSIHAWINPYRTMTDKEFATVDDSYATKRWYSAQNRNDYMVYNQQDGRYWLRPGNEQVQRLIIDGAKEIVERYDVDGVHLDDYFYCASPSAYGDTAAEAKTYTTAMVKGLYDGIKSINSKVLFGVSPAGAFRMENSIPESDRNYLSTDLTLWCSQPGYLDYVMPQIYWEHTHSIQPFTQTLHKWEGLVTEPSVSLYVGLAPYRLSAEEIQSQIAEIGSDSSADGYCLFRYDFIHGLKL